MRYVLTYAFAFRSSSLSLLCALALSACGKADNSTAAQGGSSAISSAVSSEEYAKTSGSLLAGAGLPTPAWGNRPAWNSAVLKVVSARLSDFEKARDVEVFCPGYKRAAKNAQMHCWLMLAAAISRFESAFDPGASFREPDGNYSIGLLALSPGECPNALSHKSLQQAEGNLVCGMNRMATLISRYGYIDGPADNRGASRYWSTLRAPYKRWDPTRKKYLNLGKRNLILPLIRGYRGSGVSREVRDLDEAMPEALDLWAWEPRVRGEAEQE